MPLALAPKIYVHLTIHVHRVPSATCTLTPDAAVVDGGHYLRFSTANILRLTQSPFKIGR